MNLLISIILVVANLTGVTCNKYHFVDNQMAGFEPPAKIYVTTSDNVIHEVPLDRVTGGVAHYIFDGGGMPLLQPSGVFGCFDAMWSGQFVQSDCINPTAVTLTGMTARSRYAGFGVAMATVGLVLALVFALAARKARER